MRYLLSICLIINIAIQVVSQDLMLNIKILDITNKKYIPYASVYNKHKHIGFYADSSGVFAIPSEFSLADTLLVSSVGYNPLEVTVKNIMNNSIYLSSKINILKEVSITPNAIERIYGSEKKYSYFVSSISEYESNRNEMAFFIKNKDSISAKIISVSFYISNDRKVNCPFRVRLYKSKDGYPSDDILVDNLIVNYKSKSSWLEIMVGKYNLFFKDDGLFLSIESLYGLKKSGFYKSTNTTTGKIETHYGQALGLTDEYDTAISFQREFNGTWKPFSVKFPDNLSTKTFYPMMRIKVK